MGSTFLRSIPSSFTFPRLGLEWLVVFTISLCLLIPCVSFAQSSPDVSFESANKAFRKNDFANASGKYSKLIDDGHFSKDLFFNLGTAKYRSGSFGEGVLWFRRAQVLDPGMPEVEQNMKFLRSKLGFLEFTSSRPERTLLRTSPALLRWLSSLGFWISAFALAALIFVRQMDRFRALQITALVFGLLLASSSILANTYRAQHLAIENFATITQSKTNAVTAPTPDAKSVIELPPGSEVKILQDADRWTYVEIPGDLRGWVRSENLKAVWPISK